MYKKIEIKGWQVKVEGKTYTVLKRRYLANKPEYYLYDIAGRSYLSSLYETGESNTYHLDKRGSKEYLLRFFNNGSKTYEIEEVRSSKRFKKV